MITQHDEVNVFRESFKLLNRMPHGGNTVNLAGESEFLSSGERFTKDSIAEGLRLRAEYRAFREERIIGNLHERDARGMVVSHWQVPSAATAGLMTGLFARLGPDLQAGAAASLQGAQQALIARSETAHPFFWAAFVMVGDGQADSRLPVARGSRP